MSEKSYTQTDLPLESSTIETVDGAVYDWLSGLKLSTTTNKGFVQTPIIWSTSERVHQYKSRRELRDRLGALVLPIIILERTGIVKDLSRKGIYMAALPGESGFDPRGGSIVVDTQIQEDKSANFQNAYVKQKTGGINFPRKNKKTVYKITSVPLPIYIEANYSIILWTEYQQQMNDLSQPFMTLPGGVNLINVQKNGHRFEIFVQQDFAQTNDTITTEHSARKLETKVSLKVLGYLVGGGVNDEKPKKSVRESAVDVRISNERVLVNDKPPYPGKEYRAQ